MTRAELKKSYAALPLPTTNDESWRFTDLKGFDPESFTAAPGKASRPASMLDLDVAGLAHVGEAGIEIERAPAGVSFEQLAEDHPRLHELVGWDEKFAAHNAAAWKAGLLVRVPKGVEFIGETYDSGVCHMGFCKDLDGNVLILHRRYAD